MKILYVNLDKEIEILNEADALKAMEVYRTWALIRAYKFEMGLKV